MSLVQQGVDRATTWTPAAIHDTVAAIARQGAYAQNVAQSLLGRFLQYVIRRVVDLFRFFHDAPGARPIAITLAALLVIAVVARVVVMDRVLEARRRAGPARGRHTAELDPMVRSRALAAAGQHIEAAHVLYVAVLQQLASRGWIRPHASKTGGDYARELRRQDSAAYAPFRAFNARFEQLIYGFGACTPENFDELLERASQLIVQERAA